MGILNVHNEQSSQTITVRKTKCLYDLPWTWKIDEQIFNDDNNKIDLGIHQINDKMTVVDAGISRSMRETNLPVAGK